jgi:hypothetical protein
MAGRVDKAREGSSRSSTVVRQGPFPQSWSEFPSFGGGCGHSLPLPAFACYRPKLQVVLSWGGGCVWDSLEIRRIPAWVHPLACRDVAQDVRGGQINGDADGSDDSVAGECCVERFKRDLQQRNDGTMDERVGLWFFCLSGMQDAEEGRGCGSRGVGIGGMVEIGRRE